MKYPQLVSTRAVNAISDWLVSRLEQLGVEAPQIYTRLLLSLLQSSVQINDPIEFSSLETFIGNRKGGNIKRYLQCDANTLKKLNAVQCLSEIVSSEHELTNIENLVDELWEKLKDIEKQLDDNDGEDKLVIDYLANSVSSLKAKTTTTTTTGGGVGGGGQTLYCPRQLSKNCSRSNTNGQVSIITSSLTTHNSELETDPKKRYFSAFPALSKEMEESFRAWRRNAKSLTWPADRSNITITNSSSSASKMSASFTKTSTEEKGRSDINENDGKSHGGVVGGGLMKSKSDATSRFTQANHLTTSTCGLKRKTKRRKSQSSSKGRSMSNIRKGSYGDGGIVANLGSSEGSRKQNRHLSPTYWDTDFEGYWEMGPDLIKDFFSKQHEKNRNRNVNVNVLDAESVHQDEMANEMKKSSKSSSQQLKNDENIMMMTTEAATHLSPLTAQVDISFCCDESFDENDPYNSIAEMVVGDNSLNMPRGSPRRLYQRLVLPECEPEANKGHTDINEDFVLYKAKFNSNIAALWQDISDDEVAVQNEETSLWSVPGNIPWPNVAPIKENLKNFWANYYNHQFDFVKSQMSQNFQQQQQQKAETTDMNVCESLPYNVQAVSNLSTAGDFYSMPNNFENFNRPAAAAISGGRKTPVGVFLKDSIWSENMNGGQNTETDESFYLKVWNSNKKLYDLDAVYESKIIENSKEAKVIDGSFQFPAYNNLKWSEGINAGPIAAAMTQQNQNLLQVNQSDKSGKVVSASQQNVNSKDCVDSSMSTTSSLSPFEAYSSGHTPGLPTNTNHLWTDRAHSTTEESEVKSQSPVVDVGMGSKVLSNNEPIANVTLPNHSSTSSGFLEYSRIKSLGQTLRLDTIKEQQKNYQVQFSPSKVEQCYPDDENLLTSERTHFQPIKAYADGYTFDVCSSLDVINYKRSDSGYLYFESEKYLEYIRNDSYMAEDEVSATSAGVSAAPLYAGSNCEAALARKGTKKRRDDELVLKFRLMNREIACQTEDEIIITAGQFPQHPLYMIFSSSGGHTDDGMKQAYNDTLEALNKAVTLMQSQKSCQYLMKNASGNNRQTGEGGEESSLIWSGRLQVTEEIGVDEIDYCNESSQSAFNAEGQWKCNSNGGKCLGINSSYKNNNNNNNTLPRNNEDLHALWDICAACNSEYKSAPANNLLRDELKVEADQIMNDLKNMQDLYIGCTAAAAADMLSDGGESDSSSDYFWGRPCDNRGMKNASTFQTKVEEDGGLFKKDEGERNPIWRHDTQQKVQQQVNKLIAELMRNERETTMNDTNILADAAASAQRELGESLWPDDGEHSIWRINASNPQKVNQATVLKEEIQNNNKNNMLCQEENIFLSQLSWEHNNLAELWSNNTPPANCKVSTSTSTSPTPQSAAPPILMCSSTDPNVQMDCNPSANFINQEKKTKFSQAALSNEMSSSRDPNNKLTASSTSLKRIQQFLNCSSVIANSAPVTKLKLGNRKRRHSASQNYAILYNGIGGNAFYTSSSSSSSSGHKNTSNNNNKNNNNNIKISDFNNFDLKCNAFRISNHHETFNNSKIDNYPSALISDDIEMEDPSSNYLILKSNDGLILPPKQTIITCKYWTAIEPMIGFGLGGIGGGDGIITTTTTTTTSDETEGAIFSCLVDKNDTILKHVTMLARPLTR